MTDWLQIGKRIQADNDAHSFRSVVDGRHDLASIGVGLYRQRLDDNALTKLGTIKVPLPRPDDMESHGRRAAFTGDVFVHPICWFGPPDMLV